MHVRLAILEDLTRINELLYLSKAYWGYDNQFMDKFMNAYQISDSYVVSNEVFLIFEKNEMVAFYSFSLNNNLLELDNLFLHPGHIGLGKGKKIWALCVETALKYKLKEFTLLSDPNSEGFYLKMGCTKIGEKFSFMNRYVPILKYMIND